MQKTKEKLRAALVATMAQHGAPTKYEYQFSEAIESALRDAIEREIDAGNRLNFRALDAIRKAAKEKDTLEEALELVRKTFESLTEEDRITEALQRLNIWGGSLRQMEREKKITAEERANFEKEKKGAHYAHFLSEKKLSFSLGLQEWGDGRMYCTNAREHYAHLKALFELHFKQPMPELLSFLKSEVIEAGCFGTDKENGLTIRLFKNGRLDIEGMDAGKIAEINARLSKMCKDYSVIIWKN